MCPCVGGLGAGGVRPVAGASPRGCSPGRAVPLVASAPAPGEPGAGIQLSVFFPLDLQAGRRHHACSTVFFSLPAIREAQPARRAAYSSHCGTYWRRAAAAFRELKSGSCWRRAGDASSWGFPSGGGPTALLSVLCSWPRTHRGRSHSLYLCGA